jgi:hypothetical protein
VIGPSGPKGDPGSKLRIVTGGAVGRCGDDEVLITALCEGSSLYNPLAVTGNQAQYGANPESPDFKIRLVCMKR